jgi:hypothetical protein
MVELFAECRQGTPDFLDYHGPTARNAKIFWHLFSRDAFGVISPVRVLSSRLQKTSKAEVEV